MGNKEYEARKGKQWLVSPRMSKRETEHVQTYVDWVKNKHGAHLSQAHIVRAALMSVIDARLRYLHEQGELQAPYELLDLEPEPYDSVEAGFQEAESIGGPIDDEWV